MKRLLSICLILILALSCITPVYATETTKIQVSLPELPVSSYTGYDVTEYRFVNAVLKVGDSYYAFVHLLSVNGNYTGYGRSFTTVDGVSGYDLYYIYPVAYGETYKLSDDGTTWTLIYTTDTSVSSNYNASEGHILGADYLPYTEAYNAKTLVVYASPDLKYVRISDDTSASIKYSYNAYPAEVYSVSFTSGSVDGGDTTEPTEPGSGGSTEDGGNNSWSDEDKGWLGNLFDDLYTFFNNFYNNLKTKLENIASSITTSIGNFISSATSSISTFINNAVSSISGFIDGVISVINSVSASVGEWIAGVVSEIQAIYTGITDFLVSLWSDMWTAISEFFENLFKDITDYFAEKKAEAEAITEAFTSFFDSIIMLFEAVFDYSYEESGGVADGTT